MAKDEELRDGLQAALDHYYGQEGFKRPNVAGKLLAARIGALLNNSVDFRRVGRQSPAYHLSVEGQEEFYADLEKHDIGETPEDQVEHIPYRPGRIDDPDTMGKA